MAIKASLIRREVPVVSVVPDIEASPARRGPGSVTAKRGNPVRQSGATSVAVTEHAQRGPFADSSIAWNAIVVGCLDVVSCSAR